MEHSGDEQEQDSELLHPAHVVRRSAVPSESFRPSVYDVVHHRVESHDEERPSGQEGASSERPLVALRFAVVRAHELYSAVVLVVAPEEPERRRDGVDHAPGSIQEHQDAGSDEKPYEHFRPVFPHVFGKSGVLVLRRVLQPFLPYEMVHENEPERDEDHAADEPYRSCSREFQRRVHPKVYGVLFPENRREERQELIRHLRKA